MTKKTINSDQEMRAWGERLGRTLRGGETIALSGELGAGKTTLVQGLAAGLGVAERVNSPTFVIMKVYSAGRTGIKRLVHIDAYRLRDENDAAPLGLAEYLGVPDTVIVIEWAEKIKNILPENAVFYRLSHFNNNRIIEKL